MNRFEIVTCGRCGGEGEWTEARVSMRWDLEPREEQIICPDCNGIGFSVLEYEVMQ